MFQKLINADASVIAVTNTATLLSTLLNTAAAATNVFPEPFDSVVLTPEDGDIRYSMDSTPTASKGILCQKGKYYVIKGQALNNMKLIRTGSANVSVSLQIGTNL